jgi:ABC-type phosphate/phosphonate transport system permease subunit
MVVGNGVKLAVIFWGTFIAMVVAALFGFPTAPVQLVKE